MRSGHHPVSSRPRLAEQGNLTRRRRLGLLPMIAVAVPLMAACTTTAPPAPPTSVTTSAAPPTPSMANSPTARPGELSCADAYIKEPRGASPVPFTDSGVGFESLNETGFDPLPAQSAGLRWDASGYFSKSPVYLDHGVTWAEVTALQGDVTFAWVPASVWSGLSRGSATSYEAPTARFESCGEGAYTGFLGGVLTPTAHACITLGVRSNLHPEVEPVRVAIVKDACR